MISLVMERALYVDIYGIGEETSADLLIGSFSNVLIGCFQMF